MEYEAFKAAVLQDATELCQQGLTRHDKTEGGLRVIIDPSWIAGARLDRLKNSLFGEEHTDEDQVAWIESHDHDDDDMQDLIYRAAKLAAAIAWEREHPA